MMILAYFALLGRILLLGIERILVKKLGDGAESISATFLFFLFSTLFLIPAIFFVNFSSPINFKFLPYALASSLIYSVAFTLYVKSLSIADASLVSPLYNFNIFFLLILATIFLNEKFTVFKILGMVFLIYGASFLNKQKNVFLSLKSLVKDKACLLMLITSGLIAVGRIIDGFVMNNVDIKIDPILYGLSINFWLCIFLFLFILFSKKVDITISLLKEKTKFAALSGFVNSYSYVFLLIAFTQIDVSIAEPVSMLGMIVTVVLAKFIFKEKVRDRLIGVIIMIFGVWLVFF